ncbi:MAG: tRNA pseudouridine(55) synthase TruB [Lachnospiraceae bacterium]|nr:tRNA pseudouridine(55) synthase TruB [Lachnospiraceae bacterium]
MLNGIIVVNKEAGFTSHDVVAKMRGICKQKKIGHTGTLDPDAVGVLPICLGKGTKVSGMLTDSDKEYEAVLRLGMNTDTLDLSGTVLETFDVNVTEEQVREVICDFVGEIKQIPPMYSALKVNGKKLCDLARSGVNVERKARDITIYSIEILKMELPDITIKVACSKGTYIRSLCNDIGNKLGCGGVMAHLIRTKAAGYTLKDAYSLDEIQRLQDQGELQNAIKPIDSVFYAYPKAVVLDTIRPLAINGNPLPKERVVAKEASMYYRLYDEAGLFIGIFTYYEKQKLFRPLKMFLDSDKGK